MLKKFKFYQNMAKNTDPIQGDLRIFILLLAQEMFQKKKCFKGIHNTHLIFYIYIYIYIF